MSKYSQLPRDTLALLAMRAQKGMNVQDYVSWAVNALADGFDSPSLAILAGLDYGEISQTEAPDYFLKAVKELNLPIPDSELAIGNWYKTDALYRKLGLSLPDEETLLGQHLDELAEQIKEGVLDPVVGLDRIHNEIVFVYQLGLFETRGFGWDKRKSKTTNEINVWEWDELRSYVRYDRQGNEESDPNRKSKEIITFASQWLEKPEAWRRPGITRHEPIFRQDSDARLTSKESNVAVEEDHALHTKEIIDNITRQKDRQKVVDGEIERKAPDIVFDNTYLESKKGMLGPAIAAIMGTLLTLWFLYGIFFWFFRFLTEGEKVSIWTLLAGLFVVFMFGSVSVAFVLGVWFYASNLKKRNRWLKSAVRVQAEVVSRKAEYNSDALLYGDDPWDCRIEIKYSVIVNKQLVVKVKVSDRIYFRYENQNTIPICVSKSDPSCFIIEGE